ncbi:WbqC family protein [Luteimonas sp. J29]|jgi:hypothetical protein|nr:WbqC family protein [Luteimonas sp. J29]
MKQHRVAILQSSYIPWKGFFDIIHDVDEFIFLDCVQFTTRDWRSRNRIKSANGLQWLSVPVGADTRRRIQDVAIPDPSWQARHWKSIQHVYAKCRGYARWRPLFEDFYLGTRWDNLSAMNQAMVRTIATQALGITTRFSDASDYAPEGAKQELILDLVRKSGATHYLSGPAARAYIEPARFEEIGVELAYKDYGDYPEYEQPWPPFEHAVSIVDLLMCTGDEAAYHIWGHRQART